MRDGDRPYRRRRERVRKKLEITCLILNLFVRKHREPKEIARMIGKPGKGWWVRRKIRKCI